MRGKSANADLSGSSQPKATLNHVLWSFTMELSPRIVETRNSFFCLLGQESAPAFDTTQERRIACCGSAVSAPSEVLPVMSTSLVMVNICLLIVCAIKLKHLIFSHLDLLFEYYHSLSQGGSTQFNFVLGKNILNIHVRGQKSEIPRKIFQKGFEIFLHSIRYDKSRAWKCPQCPQELQQGEDETQVIHCGNNILCSHSTADNWGFCWFDYYRQGNISLLNCQNPAAPPDNSRIASNYRPGRRTAGLRNRKLSRSLFTTLSVLCVAAAARPQVDSSAGRFPLHSNFYNAAAHCRKFVYGVTIIGRVPINY